MSMRFGTVIFDCDSTLSALEGVDELGRLVGADIRQLTSLAMSGAVPLEVVYARRLEEIRPTRRAVEMLGLRYIGALVPGAEEVVRKLTDAGVVVQILSGGLAPAVKMLAHRIGVPDARSAAVDITFDDRGDYLGFDRGSPLARSGGKRRWIETVGKELPAPRLMVGDGITDLEVRPAVDAFAAFTGVVTRPEVVKHADVVIAGPSLLDLLPYCGLEV